MNDIKFEIIPFYILNRIFPNDTMWVAAGSDIYGYSYTKSIYIEIEDGMCSDYKCEYITRVYKANQNLNKQYPFDWEFGYDKKPLMSLFCDGSCFFDEIINFSNEDDIFKFRKLFK